MGFIDLFKDFHREAIRQEFPTSARVLYDTLLYEFNGRYWTEEIGFSERDLSALTGLSAATVHRAVKFLSDRNFIKTRRAKHGTAFKLLGENVPEEMKQSRSSNEAVVKQERSSCEAVEPNPNIHVREDVKTLDHLSTSTATRACAPVNYDIDRLVARWEQSEAFGKIDMLIVAKLTNLLKTYTCDEILSAMDKAILGNDNRRGVNYNYFEAILKGGDKRNESTNNARLAGVNRTVGGELETAERRGNARRPTATATSSGAGEHGTSSADTSRFTAPDTSWIYNVVGHDGADESREVSEGFGLPEKTSAYG